MDKKKQAKMKESEKEKKREWQITKEIGKQIYN
jgi:hypothetical protein